MRRRLLDVAFGLKRSHSTLFFAVLVAIGCAWRGGIKIVQGRIAKLEKPAVKKPGWRSEIRLVLARLPTADGSLLLQTK